MLRSRFQMFFRWLVTAVAVFALFLSGLGIFVAPVDMTGDGHTVKNVIMLIGDGMGFNHLEKTKAERGIEKLNMERFPVRAESETNSLWCTTTDSAAGGTALSCGIITQNRALATFGYDMGGKLARPYIVTDIAIEKGMKTGIVTTDSTDGATPASFSVHTSDRGNSEDISGQQAASEIDLIWGAVCSTMTADLVAASGKKLVTDRESMNALEPDEKSIGQFSGETWRTSPEDADVVQLEEMAMKAIELLSENNDNGFFLMIEGAHIDKRSHSNDGDGMTDALVEFDKTIGEVLEYAEEDGNTAIIITADHETGGITLKDGEYVFTKSGHSSANVPVFAYNTGDYIENGDVFKNTNVAKVEAALITGEIDTLPAVYNVRKGKAFSYGD